jgi:2-dehydropantoate 2-reductase
MIKKDLSILVVGAGAVGGITAAFLKLNGINVEILCRQENYASLISNHGLEINGFKGGHIVKIPAYSSVNQINGIKDVILLATKATDMNEAARSVLPVLAKDGFLVSLQNGICEDDLAVIAGNGRIVGCVTGWGATMEYPGRLSMTSGGDFILGYPSGPKDRQLVYLAELLSCVVPVRTTDNITGHLYSKLIINSCITSLGAICGLYLGRMLSIPKLRRIFIEIIREAMSVADGMNIKVEVFGGKLDFRKFIEGDSFIADLRRHIFIMIIGFKYRRLKSSSLQSLERGKPTEIDYLNGYIVRNGIRTGISVPVNALIVKMIHEIEENRRDISPENFNDPFFDRFS